MSLARETKIEGMKILGNKNAELDSKWRKELSIVAENEQALFMENSRGKRGRFLKNVVTNVRI